MLRILIVEADPKRATAWIDRIDRPETDVMHVLTGRAAVEALSAQPFDAIVLNLSLPDQSALAVADFASFKRPGARVVFVTEDGTFSDGSIFSHVTNASALLSSNMAADDIAAIVEYHAAAS